VYCKRTGCRKSATIVMHRAEGLQVAQALHTQILLQCCHCFSVDPHALETQLHTALLSLRFCLDAFQLLASTGEVIALIASFSSVPCVHDGPAAAAQTFIAGTQVSALSAAFCSTAASFCGILQACAERGGAQSLKPSSSSWCQPNSTAHVHLSLCAHCCRCECNAMSIVQTV
jgi:hypothetical protein